MTKNEFLESLRKNLSALPAEELEERIEFYAEMIDDRVEEGLSEEEAVADIGPVEGVTEKIIEGTPLSKLVKESVKPRRRMKGWETAMLIIGSPLWVPLLIAGVVTLLALLFTFYTVIWSIVFTVFVIGIALGISALGALFTAGVLGYFKLWPKAALCLAGALVLAGLTILWFFVCKGAVKAAAWLTKKTGYGVKSLFFRRKRKNAERK